MSIEVVHENFADTKVLRLRVAEKRPVADDICLFELKKPDGSVLPAFEAGAHILVETPAGLARRYSLCNAPGERESYVIAVKRERAGGGGSASMVDDLQVGHELTAAVPLNYFPLATEAGSHLLIAGGIGITPILAMARQLQDVGKPFRIVYCTRSPEAAAFLDILADPALADRVMLHHDGGDPARALDFKALLNECAPGQHLYCCGPRSLMQAVREAARHWPSETVHFEDFGTSAAQEPEGGEKAFRVVLARTGRTVTVTPGTTILEALRQVGLDLPCSCEAGTCGSCRTGLLAGTADHRDFVLDDDEQETAIIICVSRAISEELTLDA